MDWNKIDSGNYESLPSGNVPVLVCLYDIENPEYKVYCVDFIEYFMDGDYAFEICSFWQGYEPFAWANIEECKL